MTAPDVNASIPAATCDDTPQPAAVEVMASAGEMDGILLAVAVPGRAYEAVTLTPDAARQLMSTLGGAVAHVTGAPVDSEPLAPAAHQIDLPSREDRATARCTADPDAARDWLTSPAQDRDRPTETVADALGIDEFFGVDDPDVNLHLTRLFEAGQAAGVFGVAGHTVELWHVTDDEGTYDGHLIVARRANDTGLTSGHVPVDHLVDSDLTGVDAAVSVLDNAAAIVNELLGASTATTSAVGAGLARVPDQAALSSAGRAFPALDVAAGTSVAATWAGAAPVAQTPQRRSR